MRFLGIVFRGFGHFFWCNRLSSGLLVFAALLLISWQHALLSLMGSLATTGPAYRIRPYSVPLNLGFLSVNGALFGLSWLFFPEVPFPLALIMTLLVGLGMGLLLLKVHAYAEKRKGGLTLFSLPAVAAAWTAILLTVSFGRYDLQLFRGWAALYGERLEQAQICFAQATPGTDLGKSFSLYGRGWAAFKQNRYQESLTHYKAAMNLLPERPEAWDGIAWALFKMGDSRGAAAHFKGALERSPLLMDAWDGLGWAYWYQGVPSNALPCFKRAAMLSPLLADPHIGMSRCYAALGLTDQAKHSARRASILNSLPLKQPLALSSLQILAWCLFFAAIVVHSRVSAAAALSAVALTALFQWIFPASMKADGSVNLYFNAVALSLAFSGCYLVLNRWSMAASGVMILLMNLAWPLCMRWEACCGLPVLYLPINFALMSVLALIPRLRLGEKCVLVPLRIAVTTPENVRFWNRQRLEATRR